MSGISAELAAYFENELELIAEAEQSGQLSGAAAEAAEAALSDQVERLALREGEAQRPQQPPTVYDLDAEYDEWDDQFEDTVLRVQERHGRELTETEIERLHTAADYRDDPSHIDESAIYDVSKRADRIRLINERVAEADPDRVEPAETVAPLAPDASRAERIAHINQRAQAGAVQE